MLRRALALAAVVAVAGIAATPVVDAAVPAKPGPRKGKAHDDVLLRDPLRRESDAFSESDGPDSSLRFAHGAMRVVEKVIGGSVFVEPTLELTPRQQAAVSVQVDVSRNDPATGVGIYCRHSDAGSYILWLGDRVWGIVESTPAGLRQLAGGRTNAARPGRASNEVRGECTSPADGSVRLRLLVDGEVVGALNDTTPLAVGTVGLYVEAGQAVVGRATFRNLLVERRSPA
jgi:hypothetical protein